MKKLFALSVFSILLLPGCGGEANLDAVEVDAETEAKTNVETAMDNPEMAKKYAEEMKKGQRDAMSGR